MEMLKSEKVNELFYSCFFDDDEIVNGRPVSEFVSISSINPETNVTIAFSTEKLNAHKNTIIKYIDSLLRINEGNSLDNLFFDKDGNNWCKDMQTLDQLIMMALACQLVSITTIEADEVGNEETIIFKRTRENDSLKVVGTSPEEFPEVKDNQLFKGYTEEEKELIAENKRRITQELEEYNEIINIGLGFFGVHAVISDSFENQLDFYDKDDNHLYSKKFEDTDGILGVIGAFGLRLSCQFKYNCTNEIIYMADGNRHIFMLNSLSDEHYGYRVEISKDKNDYSKILVYSSDVTDDYIIKKIDISDKYLNVELNNQFGPYGNYEDGEKRSLVYNGKSQFLGMVEDEWFTKGHFLYVDSFGISLDNEKILDRLTKDQFDLVAFNIVTHPRNKELLLYTMGEMDKKFPGIKEFIGNNFPLYNFIVNSSYQSDHFTDEIVKSTIHKKCDLRESEKGLLKK